MTYLLSFMHHNEDALILSGFSPYHPDAKWVTCCSVATLPCKKLHA